MLSVSRSRCPLSARPFARLGMGLSMRVGLCRVSSRWRSGFRSQLLCSLVAGHKLSVSLGLAALARPGAGRSTGACELRHFSLVDLASGCVAEGCHNGVLYVRCKGHLLSNPDNSITSSVKCVACVRLSVGGTVYGVWCGLTPRSSHRHGDPVDVESGCAA